MRIAFLGCGVDAKHFAGARDSNLPCLPTSSRLCRDPIYGYIGVVDERIDYDLLARLWPLRRRKRGHGWAFDENRSRASLPQRANLHWLGARLRSAATPNFDVV